MRARHKTATHGSPQVMIEREDASTASGLSSTPNLGESAAPLDPYAGRPGRQWWLVSCLMLLLMLGAIDRQVVTLLVNPIKADLGLSDTQISLIYGAAFAIANFLFTIPAGYFADRISRRLIVGAGAVVWSTMSVLFGLATGFWQLLVTRAGVGFGESVIGPCSASMVRAGLESHRRGRGYALLAYAPLGGAGLALMLGGGLMQLFAHLQVDALPLIGHIAHWRLVLIVVGALGAPVGLLMFTVREPSHARSAVGEDPATGQVGATFREALDHLRRHWRLYAPLIGYQACSGVVASAFGAWIAAMLGRNFGLSIPQIAAILGPVLLLISPIGLFLSGWLLDRAQSRGGVRAMVGVSVILALLFWATAWLVPLTPTLALFLVALLAHSMTGGAAQANGSTLLAAITPTSLMGKIAAIQLVIYGVIATSIGPLLVAIVSDTVFAGQGLHSLAHAMSVVLFGCGFVGVVLLMLMRRGLGHRLIGARPDSS